MAIFQQGNIRSNKRKIKRIETTDWVKDENRTQNTALLTDAGKRMKAPALLFAQKNIK